jgi:hypothetical protein
MRATILSGCFYLPSPANNLETEVYGTVVLPILYGVKLALSPWGKPVSRCCLKTKLRGEYVEVMEEWISFLSEELHDNLVFANH